MLTCSVCPERSFGSVGALHQHQSDSKNHYYCRSCTMAFKDRNELFDHAAEVHSTTCGSCRRMFASEKGVQRHFLDSPKHPKCWSCRIGFRDCADLNSHKAEVHGSSRTRRRASRKKRRQRSFSPTASSTDHSSASTLLLLSPASSALSLISDRNSMIQREVTAVRHHADGVSTAVNLSTQLSRVSCHPDSPRTSIQPANERRGASPSFSNCDSSEASRSKTGNCAESYRYLLQDRERNRQVSPLEHGEQLQSRSSAALLDFGAKPSDLGETAEASKNGLTSSLLEMCLPLQLHSDSSSDDGAISGHPSPVSSIGSNPPNHRTSPQGTLQSKTEDILSLSLPWGKTNSQYSTSSSVGIVDTMLAAARARTAGAARPASPLRLNSPSRVKTLGMFPWLSRLPTILDETEAEQVQDLDNYSEAPEEPAAETPPEKWDLSRPAGRRKRRLSLSPTLPSIPETVHIHEIGSTPQVDQDDSDSDSSQGIYEHRGEDFLYDSLSENERCQTPMTYLTADELDFDIDAKRNTDYSTSPILLVEDLTRLAEKLCSSSVTDNTAFDPGADPFELHPSANNSPMSATFPKRPRAWSLSDTPYDSRYLSPGRSRHESEDNGSKGERENPGSGVNAGENEVESEPSEAAITADEPVPRVIEEDLFSEPDEIMGPMPNAIDSIIEADAGEARFAEEGHPLRSLISLDTLPLTAEGPDSAENIEPPSTSQPGGERHNHEGEAAVERSVLRCRLCQLDPCKDVTATFCGHIFCNECITREVTAKSKCPVCNVPTLLYCLFKLDLSL